MDENANKIALKSKKPFSEKVLVNSAMQNFSNRIKSSPSTLLPPVITITSNTTKIDNP